MGSEDEYDALELPELSSDDWARIDTQVAAAVQAFEETKAATPTPIPQVAQAQSPGAGPSTPRQTTPVPETRGYTPSRSPPPPLRSPYRNGNASRSNSGFRGGSYASSTGRLMNRAARLASSTSFRSFSSPSSPSTSNPRDILTLFRTTHLSVSDLVGPAWCEVKFDYNLRWGPRWARVMNKPDLVVSASGKEIVVRKERALKGEVIKEAGSAVHKVLEQELQPVQVELPVTSSEERWASKLLTMLSCLELLKTVGYCREFPIVGFIDGVMVLGVIDEIGRRPVPPPPAPSQPQPSSSTNRPSTPTPTSGPATETTPTRQTLISQFFSPSKTPSTSPSKPPPPTSPPRSHQPQQAYNLHLIDYKTRSHSSIPPPRDQVSSRMQLMLYKRLLEPLLKPESFLDVFGKMGLDSGAAFSSEFRVAMEGLLSANGIDGGGGEGRVECLGDLMMLWIEGVRGLELVSAEFEAAFQAEAFDLSAGMEAGHRGRRRPGPVDDELELIYRMRKPYRSRSRRTRPERTASYDSPSVAGPSVPIPERSPTPQAPPGSLSREPSLGMSAAFESENRERAFGEDLGLAASMSSGLGSGAGLGTGDAVGDLSSEDAAMVWALQESLGMHQAAFGQSLERQTSTSLSPAVGSESEVSIILAPASQPSSEASDRTERPPPANSASLAPAPEPEPETVAPPQSHSRESTRSPSPSPLPPPSAPLSHSVEDAEDPSPIIGSSKFLYSSEELDEYIVDILRYWRGEREARGVDVEDTGRCHVCEFRDGCEWREAKAAEFSSAAQAGAASREGSARGFEWA